ncbi:sugar transferase [Salinicoccus kekensis]|uniref:Lipopolysaccharide/colanic/teichoic acid biosynthesis glycosyltransferase n=1 Tax=Salinicoccus kekensis TaxID=714307 RepID=A0A285UWU1_9STAP|nr:sugar transferase [Salinicoccus kekensis]SOC44701.1 lipopolysaccharide/colanic/teichoic acid biosynthesis glycosyltransferase [Salinicoccus kekensis]
MNKVSKRVLDVSVGAVALIAVSPVLVYASYKIKKEDNGPILFKQKRSGLNNEPFEMYKFRSMKVDNKVIGTHANNDENPYEAWKERVPDDFVFKTASGNNPNITNIGQVIRKYSIDELPQILNVLKGNMSIVGPRPEIIQITQHYDQKQQRRLEVKPGITGWAQVNGRSDMNHGKKIEYDLWYVDNHNFWIDLKIIWMTFIQVISGKGSV